MARTVSLAVDAIAAGGDGVGRSEGLVVFVPRTAPGDVITASIAGKGHFARGSLRSVQRPSLQRIEPPCLHYTRERCGGCQIQHIAYPFQLEAKQRIIVDAMRRIGKRELPPPAVAPSADEWRYRTKLTLALRRRGGNWIAGLHPYDDPARVFPLADCPITDRRVVSTWRDILSAAKLLPDVAALRGSIRWTPEGPTFVLMGASRWPSHAEFFAALPSLCALYWEPVDSGRQLLGDRRANRSPAASFAQVNPCVADSLRAHVRATVLARQPARVIDAYAGAGDLAVELAEAGITVTAIELDADAVRWAEQRLAPPSRAIAGRVEEVLPRIAPAEVVIVNPPRSGLHADVGVALQRDPLPKVVIYVSCDPATLARDVSRMPRFGIESVQAFDMFPQTAHVETVCVLTPAEPEPS